MLYITLVFNGQKAVDMTGYLATVGIVKLLKRANPDKLADPLTLSSQVSTRFPDAFRTIRDIYAACEAA